MASAKLYAVLFVALAAITTVQFGIEALVLPGTEEIAGNESVYWAGFGVVLALSSIKAIAVAGWYMHLLDEPRSITYIAVAGLLGVLALTAGASYSIM